MEEMKIGVVGNRTGWTYQTIRKRLMENNVYKSDVILSGGAEGVDSYAQRYAKQIGAEIRIFYPDPSKPSPQRYYDRNQMIALMSTILIAFNKGSTSRTGTSNTITWARKYNRKVIIYTD